MMKVRIYHRKGLPVQVHRVRSSLTALLARVGKGSAQLELSLVGEKRIRDLNRRYRGKDQVTDVLSFPLDIKPLKGGAPWILGEIVICNAVAQRQARRAGRSLTAQVSRLAVHGLVHLLGLDHEVSKAERLKFERCERSCLKFLDQEGFLKWDGSLQF